MKTDTLEITAAEFAKRMNPGGEPEGWQFGPDEDYSETDAIDLLQEKEDTVLSMLPEGYRIISRSTEYHGEVLAWHFRPGDVLKSRLLPIVPGTLRVYVNYPKDSPWLTTQRPYHTLPAADFSADLETGVITIPSLVEGDWVYVTHEHRAAPRLRMLKRLALDLAIVQVVRDTHMDMENYQVYQDLEANVYSTFKKMREKGDARLGIDLFDRVPTVIPLRSASMLADL